MKACVSCALIASLVLSNSAAAAVRVCRGAISGSGVSASGESEARRDALSDWVSTVRKAFGDSYTAWRLATPKAIKCLKDAKGYTCVALAQPCTVTQVAPRNKAKPGQDI